MEKMRLSLDALEVQSFATARAGEARGTVRGHDAPTDCVECPTANANWNTCWATCADSCNCGSGSGPDTQDCGGYSDWACTGNCSTTWYVSLCW